MNGAGDAILLALVYTITPASSLVFVKAAVWQAPGSSGLGGGCQGRESQQSPFSPEQSLAVDT